MEHTAAEVRVGTVWRSLSQALSFLDDVVLLTSGHRCHRRINMYVPQ